MVLHVDKNELNSSVTDLDASLVADASTKQ